MAFAAEINSLKEKDDECKTLRSVQAASWVEEKDKPVHEIIKHRIREITEKYTPTT